MDLLGLDDLLTPDERDIRDVVRRFCADAHVLGTAITGQGAFR